MSMIGIGPIKGRSSAGRKSPAGKGKVKTPEEMAAARAEAQMRVRTRFQSAFSREPSSWELRLTEHAVSKDQPYQWTTSADGSPVLRVYELKHPGEAEASIVVREFTFPAKYDTEAAANDVGSIKTANYEIKAADLSIDKPTELGTKEINAARYKIESSASEAPKTQKTILDSTAPEAEGTTELALPDVIRNAADKAKLKKWIAYGGSGLTGLGAAGTAIWRFLSGEDDEITEEPTAPGSSGEQTPAGPNGSQRGPFSINGGGGGLPYVPNGGGSSSSYGPGGHVFASSGSDSFEDDRYNTIAQFDRSIAKGQEALRLLRQQGLLNDYNDPKCFNAVSDLVKSLASVPNSALRADLFNYLFVVAAAALSGKYVDEDYAVFATNQLSSRLMARGKRSPLPLAELVAFSDSVFEEIDVKEW